MILFIKIFVAGLIILPGNQGLAQEGLLADIIARIEKIDSVSYMISESGAITADRPLPECIAGDPGITVTKVWVKKGYLRREVNSPTANAKKVIQVFTPTGTHIYNSYSNVTTQYEPSFTGAAGSELGISRKNADIFKVLGAETIDGKETTVLEKSFPGDDTVYHSKYWIWNEKGVPLKVETQWTIMEYLNLQSVQKFTDYSFEDIPESVFDVANILEIQSSTITLEKSK